MANSIVLGGVGGSWQTREALGNWVFLPQNQLGKAGVGAIATCRLFSAVVPSVRLLEETEIGQHWSSTGNLFY